MWTQSEFKVWNPPPSPQSSYPALAGLIGIAAYPDQMMQNSFVILQNEGICIQNWSIRQSKSEFEQIYLSIGCPGVQDLSIGSPGV